MLLLLILLLLFLNMILSMYFSHRAMLNLSKYAGPLMIWMMLSIFMFLTPVILTGRIYEKEISEKIVSTIKYLVEN